MKALHPIVFRLNHNFWATLALATVWFEISQPAAHAAINTSDWRQTQSLDIPAPGLIKIPLPAESLGALRPGAADLRVLDPTQGETGWYLERPLHFAPDAPVRDARSFKVTLRPRSTVVLVETGVSSPVGGLALETGAGSYLKAMTIEGMGEDQVWHPIAAGVPLYRRYQGESRSETTFAPRPWQRLRITLDDSTTDPVVVTGVRLLVVTAGPTTSLVTQPVRIVARDESPRETRLTLDLGSANLEVASFLVTTDEGLFIRPVSVRIRAWERGEWVEQTVARGLLYRDLAGTNTLGAPALTPPLFSRLELGASLTAREVILVIQNGDSPPLPINAVAMELQPVRLVFYARQPGHYQLLVGNLEVPAPRYDLAAFAEQIKITQPGSGVLGPLRPNELFRPSTIVPDPFVLGASGDFKDWFFRKSVQIHRAGAQLLELDAEALARARPDLADLRLISDGRQRPFVRDPNPAWRTQTVNWVLDPDPKRSGISRWKIALPFSGLPITSLVAQSAATLFDRTVSLHESVDDGRGDKVDRFLGEARWRRAPGEVARALTLELTLRPITATLWLEIRDQDNAPIPLSSPAVFYPAPRIRFLAPLSPATALYYGNPNAPPPGYDLEIVARQLMVAETDRVTIGAEERIAGSAWTQFTWNGPGIWFFWATLAVVVGILLWIIKRLLPVGPPT